MRYVTTKEAADSLGLHPNTLRRYADSGWIDCIKTEGGQRRYDIDSYIERSKWKASDLETKEGEK